jgi:hypothetical protein
MSAGRERRPRVDRGIDFAWSWREPRRREAVDAHASAYRKRKPPRDNSVHGPDSRTLSAPMMLLANAGALPPIPDHLTSAA